MPDPYNSTHTSSMGCGRKCSPIPSPHHPPTSLPERASLSLGPLQYDQIHLVRAAMTAIASILGFLLLLFVVLKFLGRCYTRRYYNRRRNSPILFDIHGDSAFSDDDTTTVMHPIWFINTVGLQQSVIDSIAVFKYRKDDGLVEGTECSVCLAEFQEDESLRLLPKCSHAFHVRCIDTWLRSRKNCPLCRAPIVRESSGREVSIVTVPEPDISGETHVLENPEGGVEDVHVGEGESSQARLEEDDSGTMLTEDEQESEVSDKNLGNSGKTNRHSARVSRSVSVHSSPIFEGPPPTQLYSYSIHSF